MIGIDAAATQWVNGLSGNGALDQAMIWASAYGVPLMILAAVAQWWPRDGRSHVRHVLVAAAATVLLGQLLNQGILLFAHRARPYDAGVSHLLIARSTDYSFPSDHATASIGIACAFLLHGLRGRGGAYLAVAAVIAFSRVYLGTHYVGDVLGGAVTGLCAAMLVRASYRADTRLDRALTGIL